MKVKILKDYAAGKVGDIVDVSFPGGDEQEYIDNGFIEIIEEEPIKANTSNSQIIDYTKYNKLLDPNRETDKIKVKFLRDYGEYKKDEETFISSKNFFLFSERGYCESIKSTEPTIKAFEDFERINNLETINQKHREWLKDYVELRYSIATNSVHKMKWEKEPVYYDNSLYSQEINELS